MAQLSKLLFLATSTLTLVSLYARSAQAGRITEASVSNEGTFILYCPDGSTAFGSGPLLGNEQRGTCSLNESLEGSATSPGGAIELNANSENGGGIDTATTLTGNLNNIAITLSSLTTEDWDAFGMEWLTQLMLKYTVISGITETNNSFYSVFSETYKARFSDPNISYVNQNDVTGTVNIGLAGRYDAAGILPEIFTGLLREEYRGEDAKSIQISEIVKYTYNGKTDYLWSFEATRSGLAGSNDQASNSGNYEVSFLGTPVSTVPEPANLLGLMAVASFVATRKRK